MTDRPDYADLMARLSLRAWYTVDRKGRAAHDNDVADVMLTECLAAIKTLVAERDEARALVSSLLKDCGKLKDEAVAAHRAGWNEAIERAALRIEEHANGSTRVDPRITAIKVRALKQEPLR